MIVHYVMVVEPLYTTQTLHYMDSKIISNTALHVRGLLWLHVDIRILHVDNVMVVKDIIQNLINKFN